MVGSEDLPNRSSFGIEGCIAMQLEERSMKLIASGLGDRLDDSATVLAIIRTDEHT